MKAPLDETRRRELSRRIAPVMVIFISIMLLVLGQVLYLNLVHGDEFRTRSDLNRIRSQEIPARRGNILDRNGTYLAADEPVYSLVRTEEASPEEGTYRQLAKITGDSVPILRNRYRQAQPGDELMEVSDARRVKLQEQRDELAGFRVKTELRRRYHHPEVTAPVLGFTGEINPNELERRRREGLAQGDIVGKHGVEQYYDRRLHGRSGLRWVEVSARGTPIRTLQTPEPTPPQPGDSLPLTIDVGLQRDIAGEIASDSEGGAIVMNLQNGEILAMYSHPTYDPNSLVGRDYDYIQNLLENESSPLINRMVQSRFPPGSTFKLIPYLAAIRDEDYDPSETVRCLGSWWLGNQEFKCWRERGHGEQTLDEALVNSCNIYFYELSQELGYDPIMSIARRVGYQSRTDIDLPGETRSQLSRPEVKQQYTPNEWVGGDEVNFVIGQGYSLVSPIKQAQLLGTMLTGTVVRPHVNQQREPSQQELDLDEKWRDRLRETMDEVTDDGTGYWAQHDESYQRLDLSVLGKTGTVQVQEVDPRRDVLEDLESDTEDVDPHSWFVSAAPSDDPRIAVVVFLARSGSGGTTAAPFAREIYQGLLRRGYFPELKQQRDRSSDAT